MATRPFRQYPKHGRTQLNWVQYQHCASRFSFAHLITAGGRPLGLLPLLCTGTPWHNLEEITAGCRSPSTFVPLLPLLMTRGLSNIFRQRFHMDAYPCGVNDLIFPMMSGPGRYLMPAIESFEQHWVSWDEPLVSNRRVHWAICERELFCHMANASQEVGNICTLGEVDQSPHLHVRIAAFPSLCSTGRSIE